MTGLAEFVLARIEDDEVYARTAFADHNDNGPEWSEIWSGTVELGGTGQELLGCNDSGVSRHIERWDPARVLAECEAKRRIVEHAETVSGMDAQIEGEWGTRSGGVPWEEDQGVRLLRILAMPYASHPDYRSEWAP